MAGQLPRPKVWRHPKLAERTRLDKLRSLDCTFAEFEAAIECADVIEEHVLPVQTLNEPVLVVDWTPPLHVVVVVDEARREEPVLTVYEPDP